jgi:hypothetical protein
MNIVRFHFNSTRKYISLGSSVSPPECVPSGDTNILNEYHESTENIPFEREKISPEYPLNGFNRPFAHQLLAATNIGMSKN